MKQYLCPFCDLIDEKIIAESSHFLALEAKYQPFNDSHLLIVTKEHIACYSMISSSLISELESFILDLSSQFFQKQNICLSEMGGIFQSVPHAHFHMFSQDIKTESLDILSHLENYDLISPVIAQFDFKRSLELLTQLSETYVFYSDLNKTIVFESTTLTRNLRLRTLVSTLSNLPELDRWTK